MWQATFLRPKLFRNLPYTFTPILPLYLLVRQARHELSCLETFTLRGDKNKANIPNSPNTARHSLQLLQIVFRHHNYDNCNILPKNDSYSSLFLSPSFSYISIICFIYLFIFSKKHMLMPSYTPFLISHCLFDETNKIEKNMFVQ